MKIINRFAKNHPDHFIFQIAEHVFPHDHFLGRTVLRFIPKTWTPNKITWIRVACVPLVAVFMFFHWYKWATLVFLSAAFTDALDGSLARTRNQVTKFGMLFDPFADKLLIGVMVLFLVFQNYNWKLGVAVIGVEIVIMVTALIADITFKTVRAANMWGKIKMIMQVLAVFLTLAALIWESPGLFVIASWLFGVAVGFAVISLFSHGI